MSEFGRMTEAELMALISVPERESDRSGSNSALSVSASPRQAAEEILERHYEWLKRLCLVEFRDPADARDCLQEVMFEIAKSLPRFDGRSELRTWMFVIAKRTAYRVRGKNRKREERFPLGTETDAGEGAPAELVPSTRSGEDLVIESEAQRRLIELVRMLPEKQRHAVFFHYFEDLSVEETAARLGCSIGTVKTHLHRGRNRLKELLEGTQ